MEPESKFIFAFSIIHLPSLYFWLSSNASTYSIEVGSEPGVRSQYAFTSHRDLTTKNRAGALAHDNEHDKASGKGEDKKLTYFQPRTV
jgi:hypothetical protein